MNESKVYPLPVPGNDTSTPPNAGSATEAETTSPRRRRCATTAAMKRLFCPMAGVVSGDASAHFAADTQGVLRFRLKVVAVLMLAASSLFMLRGLLLADVPWFAEQLFPLVVVGGACAVLFSRRQLSLGRLRLVELVMFATVALHLFAVNYLITVQFVSEGRTAPIVGALYRFALGYFALITVYGMFIPNTWRRTAAVTAPMVLAPALLTAVLKVTNPAFRDQFHAAVSSEDITYAGLLLLFGALIATVGAHIIHRIRSDAMQAREMGLYQLEEKIASGGMGDVWRARHRMLTRPAAIKTIRPEVIGAASSTAVKRFEREAQATAALSSPHTVELYDFGVTDDGTFYYVMEYLDGLDLETLIKQFGPQPPERVVHVLRQAASSLAEAHAQRLVHRDIKPSNLHLSSAGLELDWLKVLDFGLVKRRSPEPAAGVSLTSEQATTGTPAFMPPEVALGDREVDARTDIYALGCVAYWLLTGKLVFESTSPMELIVDHVKTRPMPPSQRAGGAIPSGLDELVMRCLEKDPADRPQSMLEVARSLDELEQVEPGEAWTQARAAGWWQQNAPAAMQLNVA